MTITEMNKIIEAMKKVANFTDEATISVNTIGYDSPKDEVVLTQTINNIKLLAKKTSQINTEVNNGK